MQPLKGKALEVANQILEAFASGNVPNALAQIYIHSHIECPASSWSWRNRLLVALSGHYDARGYRQWLKVGRNVIKGQRATYILAPRSFRAKADDPDRNIEAGDMVIAGFIGVPVFGYEQTEGEPLPGHEQQEAFVNALPLVDVARGWDLRVSPADIEALGSLGSYRHGTSITIAVENLSTWAHELVHAADDRCGTLTKKSGQQLDNEVVAEFGGAVLLECLGYKTESDRGGAFEYIEGYAKTHKRSVLGVCTELLDRTCKCVELILQEADETALSEEAA